VVEALAEAEGPADSEEPMTFRPADSKMLDVEMDMPSELILMAAVGNTLDSEALLVLPAAIWPRTVELKVPDM